MSHSGWMTRIRAWFAARREPAASLAPRGASWRAAGSEMALAATAVAEMDPPAADVPPAAETAPRPAPAAAPATATAERPTTTPPRLDPLDPPWMDRLDALADLGRHLQGHRQTAEALLRIARQLPELTSDQTDHIVQTNRLLEEQNHLLKAVLDTLAGLRASMQTVDEAARRHLTAIGTLEASHREVLRAYQEMMMKTHRRLGRLAAWAAVMSALALGGAAWVAYLILAAS